MGKKKVTCKKKVVVEIKWSFKIPDGACIELNGGAGTRIIMTLEKAKELLRQLQKHIPEIEKHESDE